MGHYESLLIRTADLEVKCAKLQEALNKARGPEGEPEAKVIEWLRLRGYKVEKILDIDREA